jgi:hypothetical protein
MVSFIFTFLTRFGRRLEPFADQLFSQLTGLTQSPDSDVACLALIPMSLSCKLFPNRSQDVLAALLTMVGAVIGEWDRDWKAFCALSALAHLVEADMVPSDIAGSLVVAILEKLSAGGAERKHTTCQALEVVARMVPGIEAAPQILRGMADVVMAFWADASRDVAREVQSVVNDGNLKQVNRLSVMMTFFTAALEVDGQLAGVYAEVIFDVLAAALLVRDSEGILCSRTVALLCAVAKSDPADFTELAASLGDEFHAYVEYLGKAGGDPLGDLMEVVQTAVETYG